MNAEEFFNNNWDKCLSIIHKDNRNLIMMVYDTNLLRLIKMNSLSGEKTIFKKTEQTEILFCIDYHNEYLLIDENIWLQLDDAFRIYYIDDFIRDMMLYKKINYNYNNIELQQLVPLSATPRNLKIKYDDDWELLNL